MFYNYIEQWFIDTCTRLRKYTSEGLVEQKSITLCYNETHFITNQHGAFTYFWDVDQSAPLLVFKAPIYNDVMSLCPDGIHAVFSHNADLLLWKLPPPCQVEDDDDENTYKGMLN